MKKSISLLILSACITISGCKKDDDNQQVSLSQDGVYIVNEGAFGSGNSSISFLDFNLGSMTNNLFGAVNGFPLGDVAQSMTIHNNYGYIVVNNSAKVEVVNLNDFKSVTTINGLQGPRYMVIKDNRGFISDWFSNTVAVVNLTTNTINKTIPTGAGPEQMLVHGNNLYVTNIGGFGNDSTVTIIDTQAETVSKTLVVGTNPNSICKDVNGFIWVLCGGSTGPDFTGGTADDIAGSLWKVNPATLTATMELLMNAADHPLKLQVDPAGSNLYFLHGDNGYNGSIATLPVNSPAMPPVVLVNKSFYGLGLDPDHNVIYGGFAPGFSQNGYLFRYSSDGVLFDSLETGIAPNNFAFR